MTGIYVVVGASVLGVFSGMLIAWSLWTRSQARKRARQRQLLSGQYAAIPPAGHPPLQQQAPPAGHTVVAAPPAAPEQEPRTEFMSSAELFGEVAPPEEPTQFLSTADLFGVQPEQPDDEEEIATAFMSTEELFNRRTDATVVLSEQAIIPEPAPEPPPKPRPPAPAPARRPSPPQKPAPAPRYTGFVGDRADDSDDEDDDLDDDDPETELVHQAELLRLITHNKRSE
ncbi:MAG: hypothetical protein R6X02_05220 [Enhygromyxa sp.]